MYQLIALVERPNCSSTRYHCDVVQPWPPSSGEYMPPMSPSSRALSPDVHDVGRRAGARQPSSAVTSSGISTSSTKARARSRTSRSAGDNTLSSDMAIPPVDSPLS